LIPGCEYSDSTKYINIVLMKRARMTAKETTNNIKYKMSQ